MYVNNYLTITAICMCSSVRGAIYVNNYSFVK